MLTQEEDDRWNNVGERYFVLLDGGAEFLDVKLGHDNECQTTVEALMYQAGQSWSMSAPITQMKKSDRQTVDMKERQES